MEGATPLTMWQTAGTLRRADWNDLLFLMQSRGVYKVGRNGVKFKVGNATLGYGACEPKLYSLCGREVFITIDPGDLSHCFAWTPQHDNRRFIARLESNRRISPLATVDELREANATIQRRRKIGRQADREAPARTRSVAQELTAQRRDRLAELRATGTEGENHRPNITPVRTAFGGVSKSVQAHRQPPRSRSDTAAAMKALTFGRNTATEDQEPQGKKPRATLEMLAGIRPTDGQEQGTDAEQPRLDPFGLIAGNRHERSAE